MEKKHIVMTGIIFCLLIFAGNNVFADQRTMEKLARLEGHLHSIHSTYKFEREITGWTLTGTGALLLGGAYYINDSLSDSFSYYDSSLGMLFYLPGAAIAVPGLIVLSVKSEFEVLPEKYFSLPQDDQDERTFKVNMGETYLESLSDTAAFNRQLGAYSVIGVGVFQYFSVDSLGYDDSYYSSSYSSLNYYKYSSIATIGAGVLLLLFESFAEQEFTKYKKWKSRPSTVTYNDLEVLPFKGNFLASPHGVGFEVTYSL